MVPITAFTIEESSTNDSQALFLYLACKYLAFPVPYEETFQEWSHHLVLHKTVPQIITTIQMISSIPPSEENHLKYVS